MRRKPLRVILNVDRDQEGGDGDDDDDEDDEDDDGGLFTCGQ